LCRAPHGAVVLTPNAFAWYGIDIVPEVGEEWHQPGRQVLVELDPHRTWAAPTGRSSCAEAAANAIAARTSASVSVGKSSRSSAVVAPSARLARTVRSVTLVPLDDGFSAGDIRAALDSLLVVHSVFLNGHFTPVEVHPRLLAQVLYHMGAEGTHVAKDTPVSGHAPVSAVLEAEIGCDLSVIARHHPREPTMAG
jgi:hypothetical protein